jgi:hypothetical protein
MTSPGDGNNFELTPEQLLGATDLTDDVHKRYEQLRAVPAANMVSALSAADGEYVRRQGANNWRYIRTIADGLPIVALTGNVSSRGTVFSSHYATGTIDDLSTSFEFNGNALNIEDLGANILADLSAVRATAIWIKRSTKELLQVETNRNVTAKIGQNDFWVPHIIAGHKADENRAQVDTLLMPMASNTRRFDMSGSIYQRSSSTGFKIESPIGHFMANVLWQQNLLQGTMTTGQYEHLTSLQDVLLGDGVTQQEIEQLHDPLTGEFIINMDRLPVIRAKNTSAHGIQRKRPPMDATEIVSEEFDIHTTGLVAGTISPEAFADYHVLADTQRACAMLGRYSLFESAKATLFKEVVSDPAIRLLNEK